MGLTSWPEALLIYKQVTSIDLEGNFFTQIPSELKRYRKLQKLIMDKNSLHLGELNLRGMPALLAFSAAQHPMQNKLVIRAKRNLQKVNLTKCNLISLNIKAPGLREIDLSFNSIERMSKPFWRRGYLEIVVLASNEFYELPAGVGKHKRIRKLILSNNAFRAIPPQMSKFRRLESLMFYKNQIDTLPSLLWTMTTLREIDIHHNRLSHIPAGIGMLTEVEELYLAHNQILSLPNEIGNLKNLKYLYVENNRLEVLPDSLVLLVNLQRVNLMGNNFIVFPHVVTKLVALEELDISKNDIETFPTSWRLQRNLKMLLFHDNACQEGMQCIRYLKAKDKEKTARDVKFQY